MKTSIQLFWSVLRDGGEPPIRKHGDDAGWDLIVSDDTVLSPRRITNVPTAIAIAIPSGWYGHIIGRSSTSSKLGLLVVEAVIDAGYRGELFFQVENPHDREIMVERGSRLAQILFLHVPAVRWIRTAELPPSHRGTNGFGSTGYQK